MKQTGILAALALGLAGMAQETPVDWVNPFIGCTDNGHCTPAACVPFGLVQAGADTGNKGWNYCGGYRYEDPSIMGFSQTHISGTGVPDLGDVRLQPFTGTGGTNDFRSVFRKETETAKPGYYAVTLDDFGVQVEVTAKFPDELVNDIIPAVESVYRTYAASVDIEDIVASRAHRAIVGGELGCRELGGETVQVRRFGKTGRVGRAGCGDAPAVHDAQQYWCLRHG